MSYRAHVLIVDDDAQVLAFFVRTLTRENYIVTGTTSGLDAIELALRSSPDIVMLDLSMPKPDGFETLKRLRVKRPDLRIVVVSGFMQGALLHAANLSAMGRIGPMGEPAAAQPGNRIC